MAKLTVHFMPPTAHVGVASERAFDGVVTFTPAADGSAGVRPAGATVWYAPGVWRWAEQENPTPAAETTTTGADHGRAHDDVEDGGATP